MTPWFKQAESSLEGWPDTALTVGLVVAGLIFIAIGLFSPSRVAKAAALAYASLP